MFGRLLSGLCLLSLLSGVAGTNSLSASQFLPMSKAILPVVPSATTIGTQTTSGQFATTTGYEPGQKVLWYKPSDSLLNVAAPKNRQKGPTARV